MFILYDFLYYQKKSEKKKKRVQKKETGTTYPTYRELGKSKNSFKTSMYYSSFSSDEFNVLQNTSTVL